MVITSPYDLFHSTCPVQNGMMLSVQLETMADIYVPQLFLLAFRLLGCTTCMKYIEPSITIIMNVNKNSLLFLCWMVRFYRYMVDTDGSC